MLRYISALLIVLVVTSPALADRPASVRYVTEDNPPLEVVNEQAQAGDRIIFDMTDQFEINEPLVPPEDTTLINPNLKVVGGTYDEEEDRLRGFSDAILIEHDNVRVLNPRIDGGRPEDLEMMKDGRRSGIRIADADNVVIRDAVIENATRHGIFVQGTNALLENITTRKTITDGVSVAGNLPGRARGTTVRGVRSYTSFQRGAVELIDGAYDVMAEDVYGENVEYVVVVDDHGGESHDLKDITVRDVKAGENVGVVVTTNVRRGFNHRGLTIENVKVEQELADRSFGMNSKNEAITVAHFRDVTVRNIKLRNLGEYVERAVMIEDCPANVIVEAVTVSGDLDPDMDGLVLSSRNEKMNRVHVHRNILSEVPGDQIRVQEQGQHRVLNRLITGNHAQVRELALPPSPWGTWRFRKDPDDRGVKERWFAEDIDAAGWRKISVPDQWSGTWASGYLGYGWYRTTFRFPDKWSGEPLNLEFDGVDEQAWVYVNGELVGEHTIESEDMPIGQLWDRPFEIKVPADVLRPGEVNTLVVRVHASIGDGGIYQEVEGAVPDPENSRRLPARERD